MSEKDKKKKSLEISRREFLRDAGFVMGGATLGSLTLLAACGGEAAETETVTKTATTTVAGGTVTVTDTTTVTEPGAAAVEGLITLKVNGKDRQIIGVKPEYSLAFVLREKLGLYATKLGCEHGECGSCTVLVDGKPVYSCVMLAIECVGKDIQTLEGLSDGITLHPVQQAFYEFDAHQCGFCTPGMIMSAKALLDENPTPTRAEIKEAMSGNICACGGGYRRVVDAIQSIYGGE